MYRSRGIIYNCFLCEQNPLKMGSAHSTSVHSSPAEDLPCSNIWVIFFLRLFNHFRWRKQWQHTPVLLPEKSHGRRSLVGCSPWGLKESVRTEWLHFHFSLSCIGEGNGNPLQCSCMENPRDGGVWWAAVYGVTQSQTQLKWLSSSSSSNHFSRNERMGLGVSEGPYQLNIWSV